MTAVAIILGLIVVAILIALLYLAIYRKPSPAKEKKGHHEKPHKPEPAKKAADHGNHDHHHGSHGGRSRWIWRAVILIIVLVFLYWFFWGGGKSILWHMVTGSSERDTETSLVLKEQSLGKEKSSTFACDRIPDWILVDWRRFDYSTDNSLPITMQCSSSSAKPDRAADGPAYFCSDGVIRGKWIRPLPVCPSKYEYTFRYRLYGKN